jgi:hypothetical protein
MSRFVRFPEDLAILREQRSSEQRIVDEAHQLPDGYRRPMSCEPSRALTLSVETAMAEHGPETITMDDTAEIAALVDMIDMNPHLFAERFLALERRVSGIAARENL